MAPIDALDNRPWWRMLNGYQWFVFSLAALGWMFDTMDGQIFFASRVDAMKTLMPDVAFDVQTKYGGYVTTLFILGWATGGLIFGTIGDKFGRAKTMAMTIFVYSIFTGLSGIAHNWQEFGLYRFLTGVGVGGEFAAGASLVAEVMPERARASALGMLQALSAVGNVIGIGLLSVITPRWGWQGLYFAGAFPALMAVFVQLRLKEPEKWVAARKAADAAIKAGAKSTLGRISELFTNPKLRRNTFVGLALGISGILGLWSVGYYSPELINNSFAVVSPESRVAFDGLAAATTPEEQLAKIAALNPADSKQYVNFVSNRFPKSAAVPAAAALTTTLNAPQQERLRGLLSNSFTQKEMIAFRSKGLLLQQLGGFTGMLLFGMLAVRIGRRATFAISFLLAYLSVFAAFMFFYRPEQVWYIFPFLGLGTMAPLSGYSIYFPELFPTRLRTTGTGFCYNVGRYIAAVGPTALGGLSAGLQGQYETSGFRLAAIIVGSCYAIGLIALFWAPETLGKPLMEDEPVAA